MPDDRTDGPRRGERELRSEFLRGQFRQWMEEVVAAGKTRDLFELEMWLRSFERFFRIKNQPLSEKETKQLALRNWSEELRLVDNVLLRTVQLCTSILTEDQVNLARFDKYVEGYLRKDDVVDPYIEKLVRQNSPEAGLTLLRESLEDLHVVLMDLTRLSRIPYSSFSAVGKMLYREVRRSHILALLIDKKFKPVHDRIQNPAIATTIRAIEDPAERKHAARVFLELFRLLHYLEYADPARADEDALKNTILIFSLITSETRLLLTYLERRVLKALSPDSPAFALYDSFVYCLPFELKKVINTELLDISVTRQPDIVRARVENSHGILQDCVQQSVVQLAQSFDERVEGQQIFPDFTAKLEQSLGLRDSLARLIRGVKRYQATRDEASAVAMKEEISRFYDHNMKDLMYRDWSGFELFFIEILKCTSLPALAQISHRFETFLMTLYREVQKRSILQNVPVPEDLLGLQSPA
ncbi:MAG TPA: hypothetical protein VMR21_12080 [Vicinamibacteria bacterium]|nr:hypothetical protein [Vicinamibacteria bacterium]